MRVVILLLGILALSAFVGCQSKPMVVSESQPGLEGIKVHGDWTVEVRNPDGSLATSKQFTNKFVGQHILAGLLSLEQVTVSKRKIGFRHKDSPNSSAQSDEAQCAGKSPGDLQGVLATAIQVQNDDGTLGNSLWSASCTLEISGNEPKFITQVSTFLYTTPFIKISPDIPATPVTLSFKIFDEPIEVWDGQVIAATVILSVD
jgi:hypothetical protein